MKNLRKLIASFVIGITFLAIAPLAAHAEWRQSGSNWWYTEGSSYAIGWAQIDEQWYYFDSKGYMKTGWLCDRGNWYYFYGDGTMAHDCYIGNYYLNSAGAWTTNVSSITSQEAEQRVRQYLVNHKKYVPSRIEYDHEDGNSYVIHCYDIVVDHTATSGWYYVNKTTGNISSMF